MVFLSDARRRRGLALLGLSFFTLVVSVSPLLHHDLACHLKSKTHCDACHANPIASRIERGASLEAWTLRRAGRVEGLREQPVGHVPAVRTPGRSPPA